MDRHPLKKAFGLFLICVGITGFSALFFFYTVILFSDAWPTLQGLNEGFRLLFTVPTGVLVIYASFFTLFLPLLLLMLLGISLSSGKSYLRLWQLGIILSIWIVAVMFASVTTVRQVQEIISRIQPFSANPVEFTLADEIPPEVHLVFVTTLKSEVDSVLGLPQIGYEPYMFLEVFPGLTETDFEGVEASIGKYTVQEGRLVHVLDNTKLVHNAAKVLTDKGLRTLLSNVSVRLRIDLTREGTLTEIMEALIRKDQSSLPLLLEPTACTMDAKICPDGTAVGRQGPLCEFAPCPQ